MQDHENKAVDENVPTEQTGNSNKKQVNKQKGDKTPDSVEVDTKDTAGVEVKSKSVTKSENTTSIAKAKQTFMYLGPNISGGRIFNGSVFRGGSLEDLVHLHDILEKLPEIKGLFVEITKVPKFKSEIATQGTEAHRLYTVVVSQLKKGVLKDGV